jgi:tRNA(Ile)-lysidine synthase
VRHDPAVAATRTAVAAALRGVVAGGDRVLAAVSGGADSVALAAALAHAARRAGISPGAVVVDHGLQPGSADVAAEAAATCKDLGLDPVVVESVTVGTAGGPEAAARAARYRAFESVADRLGASAVLLGHTLDDQAETVLLRLARGSGARSLAAMRSRSGRFLRPFLDLRREVTAKACSALGLPTWTDPHNADPAYSRVRVRVDALPALEAALGPGVAAALGRTAALLADDADALDEWAARVGADLSVVALGGLPAAVRGRVLRRAAISAGAPAGALTARHVAGLDRLVTGWHGQGPVSLPGGLVGERRYDRLSFR